MHTIYSFFTNPVEFGDAHVGGTKAIFSCVLIFIGIIQAAIYWNIRTDGVRRDAAVVFVRSFNSIPIVDAKDGKIKFWYFSPLIENAGGTQAANLITRINTVEQQDALPDNFDYPDFWDTASNGYNRTSLGPKHARNIGGTEISIETVIAAKTTDFKIYMY